MRLTYTELFVRMSEASAKDAANMSAAYGHFLILREKEMTFKGELALLAVFWTGFDDGQNERTLPARPRSAYRRGYHFGKRSA